MIKGVVEGVSNNYGKFSVLIGGVWYGTKAEYATFQKPEKGDEISFDNGGDGKKYLQKVTIVSSGNAPAANNSSSAVAGKPAARGGYSRGSFPIEPLDGQRSIIRQNAVTNANSFLYNFGTSSSIPPTVEDLIDIARQIEAYTAGDLDRERAKELAEAEEG